MLVVEDEPELGAVICGFLSRAELKTHLALSGEAALARARETRFQIAIVDVSLPGINGFQVGTALRKTNPDMAVILTSGLSENTISKWNNGFTADAVLLKPFSPGELLDLTRDLLAARMTGQSR